MQALRRAQVAFLRLNRGRPVMPRHLTLDEATAGLPEILASPKDEGTLRDIVIRPARGKHRDLASCEVSARLGMQGDHQAKGCW